MIVIRITDSSLIERWVHRKNEDMRLRVIVVGTQEELQELMKAIETQCGK